MGDDHFEFVFLLLLLSLLLLLLLLLLFSTRSFILLVTELATRDMFCLILFFTSHQQSFSYKGTGLPGLNKY